MKIISVNVGFPRNVKWRDKVVRTAIWKDPASGRIPVSRLNLAGDEQADLSVHGGPEKAVYAYPSEHYTYWHNTLSDADFPWGVFGENLTIEGILEDQVRVGDRLQVGSAEFLVTQPRMPCFKLGIRFNRTDMVEHFLKSKRTGFYLAVLRGGEVAAGDPISWVEQQKGGLTIADIVNLYRVNSENQELLRLAIELPALPEGWKVYFRKRLRER